MRCPACHKENPPGATNCEFCKSPLPDLATLHQPTEPVSGLVVPDVGFNKGDLIANRYLVERELGRGGMGVVYLVEDQQLRGKEVALKLISHELTANPQGKDRFVQEVLVAQELQHRNIIRVFHLDEIGGQSFFTMEYVQGKSLREVIEERKAQGGTFSLEECEAVLIPVLKALDHAHSQTPAVIHRDIKPDNIIVTGDLSSPQVKVLDFGLAKMLSPSKMTTTAMTMGTAYYMAPEQVQGAKDIDQRADLFSVGVVLYEMLTGKVPSGRFKLPAEVDSNLPVSIDGLVDMNLQQEPSDRHFSAKELAAALQVVAKDEEEAKARAAEEEERKQREAEEAAKRAAEEAERERQAEAAAKRQAELEEKRKAEEAAKEAQRKAAEETKRKLQEAEAIRKAKEAEDAAKREAEEEAKKQAEEEEAERQAEEEEAKRKEAEELARKNDQKAAREEAERKAKEEEERKREEKARKERLLYGIMAFGAVALLIFFLVDGGKDLASTTTHKPAPVASPSPARQSSKPSQPLVGALQVNSIPSGAAIYIDNGYRGTTPATLKGLKPGRYALKLSKSGYKSQTQDVRVVAGETISFSRNLKKEAAPTPPSTPKYSLTIKPKPSDATVKILNIKPKYRDGIMLEPGTYKIQVSKAGYKTLTGTVEVKDSNVVANAELEKLPAPAPSPVVSSSTRPSSPSKGDTWRDPTTGMEFVWVPGGCFQMGSNDGDDDEKPVHEVCVDGFWMGKYEVTQAEWKRIMGSNPSYFKGNRNPVENVSWNDAQSFIRKLNGKGNGTFRLPTEAEWEYAARSDGKNEKYAGGNNVGRVAWYGSNSGDKTHPVGGKAPNGLGLYDMSGNVWEWCQDRYNSSAYSKHSRNNPVYSGGGDYRVLRGGSWFDLPRDVRSAYRDRYEPGDTFSYIGFRLLRTN